VRSALEKETREHHDAVENMQAALGERDEAIRDLVQSVVFRKEVERFGIRVPSSRWR